MLTPRHTSAPKNPNTYLAAPRGQAPATGRNVQRDSSYGRPASSVYSQPSPEAAVFAAQQLRVNAGYQDPYDISPPSSPDIASTREGPYPGDVSPIEETADTSAFTKSRHAPPMKVESRSNIPMIRRERRNHSEGGMQASLESRTRDRDMPPSSYGHDVRRDLRTGEPTTSTKGRPSQVNPHEYVHGLTIRNDSPAPVAQSKPGPSNPMALRDRLRPLRRSSASPQPGPAPRPEWRGASGRAPLIAPVRDNKNVTPLRIPPKSNKRSDRNFAVLSPVESMAEVATSPLETGPISPPPENDDGAQLRPAAPLTQTQSPNISSYGQASPLAPAYPTPPLSENTIRINRLHAEERLTGGPLQPPPLQIPSNEKAIRRKPARLSGNQAEFSMASEYAHGEAPPVRPSPGHPPDEWVQPPSRFSITTYATSNRTSTPRQSIDEDAPPLPTSQQLNTPTPAPKPEPVPSILGRGRPIASSYDDSPRLAPREAVKITLDSPYFVASPTTTTSPKPRPADLQAAKMKAIADRNRSRLSVASISSLEKSLPPAPPEASAKDRVAELNAQIESLANRRMNINTAIRKMTEMMPTDNVLESDAVKRKREAEKRKVETLRAELADVERQSYQLGLSLHRAYKRLDRDAQYEPTTLWVRRVTS